MGASKHFQKYPHAVDFLKVNRSKNKKNRTSIPNKAKEKYFTTFYYTSQTYDHYKNPSQLLSQIWI